MNTKIVLFKNTDEIKKEIKEQEQKNNLYNKYKESDLDDFCKIDLYEALDLDSFRDKEIPISVLEYCVKKKSVLYHPQRNKGKNSAFIIIKKAGEILKNHTYRKVYDSAFLDESIPEDREYEEKEFFYLFDQVFCRNSIFSEIKPVPRIYDDMKTFYTFWNNFKTNRVYDNPDDIFNQCNSNRRYNMQKNKEENLLKKKNDLLRIKRLTTLAFKRDPRNKNNIEATKWEDKEIKTLKKLNILLGKNKNKYKEITKKMNEMYLTKRTPQEVKHKLETTK